MTAAVFTYGTLQIPEVMQAVTGAVFYYQRAILPDYARYTIRGKNYPAIIMKPGSETDGIVYFDVDLQSLRRLDKFEDVLYERQSVSVLSADINVRAETYIISPSFQHLLETTHWDVEQFREKYLAEYIKRYCKLLHAQSPQ